MGEGVLLLLNFAASVTVMFSLQLQTAEQAALKKSDVASAARDELETIRLRVESLSGQLQKQQNDVRTLCLDPGGEMAADASP